MRDETAAWRPEPSAPGYLVDRSGRVWSVKRGKFVRQQAGGRVVLSIRGIPRTYVVADLVAAAFAGTSSWPVSVIRVSQPIIGDN